VTSGGIPRSSTREEFLVFFKIPHGSVELIDDSCPFPRKEIGFNTFCVLPSSLYLPSCWLCPRSQGRQTAHLRGAVVFFRPPNFNTNLTSFLDSPLKAEAFPSRYPLPPCLEPSSSRLLFGLLQIFKIIGVLHKLRSSPVRLVAAFSRSHRVSRRFPIADLFFFLTSSSLSSVEVHDLYNIPPTSPLIMRCLR